MHPSPTMWDEHWPCFLMPSRLPQTATGIDIKSDEIKKKEVRPSDKQHALTTSRN